MNVILWEGSQDSVGERMFYYGSQAVHTLQDPWALSSRVYLYGAAIHNRPPLI